MQEDFKNDCFSYNPIYGTGNIGICPLNETGFERYLSANSYNYKYLSKISPRILQEFIQELDEKNAQKAKEKLEKQNNQQEIPFSKPEEKPIMMPEKNELPIQEVQHNEQRQYIEPNIYNDNFQNRPLEEVMPKKAPLPKKRNPFSNNPIKFNNKKQQQQYQPSMIPARQSKQSNLANSMRQYQSQNLMPSIVKINDYTKGKLRRPYMK